VKEVEVDPGERRAAATVRPIAASPNARDRRASWQDRNPLPPGAGSVGAALLLAGATSYGFLVVSARAVSERDFAALSVLWAATMLAGPGCFLPIEQEIARALSARRVRGEGAGPIVRRAAALAAVLLAAVLAAGLMLGPFLQDHLFRGRGALLAAWLVALAGLCVAHLCRGVLAGLGRFRGYAEIVGGEAALRFLFVVGLAAAGVDLVGWYGAALAAAPAVAVALALRTGLPRLEEGPPAGWSEISAALAWLLGASLLSTGLVNAGPIAVELLGTAREEKAAGHFLSGLVIARAPLFLFQAVQASLLPRLTQLAEERRTDELRSSLARLTALVSSIAVVGTLGAFAVGPAAVSMLFGDEFELGHRTMAMLALGSGAYMVAALLAQAVLALDGHRSMAVAWGMGLAGFVVATALASSDLFLRVEVGVVAGGLAALAAQAVALRQRLRAGAEIDPGGLIEAIHELQLEP
jgi:O-antigen/teichoic acid export membrane protein